MKGIRRRKASDSTVKKKVKKVAKRLGSEKNIPYLYIRRKGNGSQS